eukprot:1626745-Rhodomonas_salina.1
MCEDARVKRHVKRGMWREACEEARQRADAPCLNAVKSHGRGLRAEVEGSRRGVGVEGPRGATQAAQV